jgi:hypothetical protein
MKSPESQEKKFEYTRENGKKKKENRTNNGLQKAMKKIKI